MAAAYCLNEKYNALFQQNMNNNSERAALVWEP